MVHRRTTLADVAAEAGLSKTAVSLALNGSEGVRLSAGAIERAKAAAKKLNYRPHSAARTLRTKTTESFGFLSSEITVKKWAMEMVTGALRKADESKHALLISESSEEPIRQARALEAMVDRSVDGIVVAEMKARQVDAPDVPDNIPLIFANALGPDKYISILPDEYQGGREVVAAMLQGRLRSNVAIIGGHPKQESNLRESATIGERLRGIRDELKSNGIQKWIWIEAHDWTTAFGYEAMTKLISEGTIPDAVIALNDEIAAGIYNACNEFQIKIGEDISIVSFDDSEVASILRPGLTTGRLPYTEIGELAIEKLISKDMTPELILIKMPVKIRQSVAH